MRRPWQSLFLLLPALLLAWASCVVASKTVIDLVSTDPGFSILIKQLQRLRLIPFLNNRKTCTFFAPTNAAFSQWERDNPGKRIDRETLMYHILLDNVLTQSLKDSMLLETALVKDGYLGDNNEGQRVAVSKPSWRPGRINKILVGDAELLEKDWQADNGVVHVVNRLMAPPVDLVETMKKHPDLEFLYDIVHNAGLDDLLHKHQPFTVFAPSLDAFKKLNAIQIQYLRHEQGRQDLAVTFHHHIHRGAIYRQDILPGTSSVSTVEGQDLMVSLDDKLLVDNAEVEKVDILASNGVIHTVSRPLLPSALVWTAGKYLVGLNATRFADELRQQGMSHYIDDPDVSYTIFAPRDEVFAPGGGFGALGEPGEILRYHIVSGKKVLSDFKDGYLLETELFTEQLNGHAQRSKVSVKQERRRTTISLAGVEIKTEPVHVGKSLIYVLDRPLQLPLPLVKTIKQDEALSGFAQALSATGLGRRLSDAREVTVFAPNSAAWGDLGVVNDYLLFSGCVGGYADGLHYTADIKAGRTTLITSEGSELVVEKNGDVIHVGEGRLERSDQVGGLVITKDVLVESGVVHTVSSVALPPTLDITLYNILQGAGTHSFLKAFETSNITRILTNWEQDYTLFAPTDEAFQQAELEGALTDPEFVARLVRLHVIPGKVIRLEEDIRDDEASMLNNDARLSFRDIHRDGSVYGVRVKGARSRKEARVVAQGLAHPAWPDEDEGEGEGEGPLTTGMRRQGPESAADDDRVFSRDMKSAPRPGGVVYVIDRVLLPGDPDPLGAAWFWVSIVLLALLGTTALCGLTAMSIHALIQEIRQLEGYDAVPTTDEEAAVVGGDASEGRVPAQPAEANALAEPVLGNTSNGAERAHGNGNSANGHTAVAEDAQPDAEEPGTRALENTFAARSSLKTLSGFIAQTIVRKCGQQRYADSSLFANGGVDTGASAGTRGKGNSAGDDGDFWEDVGLTMMVKNQSVSAL
ncbi:hypothetical protein BGZ95_009010 [Linnemannia exigua]|uniref:FAS1 domain-containing protein n=1 Tax=Linnemannia exigua TaxID=604196 RepID=A0AAD4DKQ3_9FUNG|nr:hypothetical protein BGZ95_009010 [Linnemannia exigua]